MQCEADRATQTLSWILGALHGGEERGKREGRREKGKEQKGCDKSTH